MKNALKNLKVRLAVFCLHVYAKAVAGRKGFRLFGPTAYRMLGILTKTPANASTELPF